MAKNSRAEVTTYPAGTDLATTKFKDDAAVLYPRDYMLKAGGDESCGTYGSGGGCFVDTKTGQHSC